ncbi:MAG: aldehyde dehydrogenase family protein [Candidatus Nanopelagicales bacterium]
MTLEYPVAGAWTTGESSREVRSPFDDALIAEVPAFTAADVDSAVACAKAAMRDTPLATHERAAILDRAAVLLAERLEPIATDLAREAAKPIKQARAEVQRAVSTLQFCAAEARTFAGELVPMDAAAAGVDHLGFVLRVPIGVVGAITPFNFPLNLVAHKIGPAIAAGCAVVNKPASQTPLSALNLAKVLYDAGLPVQYLSVVPGPGSVIGDALVRNDDVEVISFTGSPEVGWGIRAEAPRKRVGLELGNNSPLIVRADGDWRAAAAAVRLAGFAHAGQSCISTQRILVEQSVKDAFVAELVALVETLTVGDPLDEATEVSALIDRSNTERVSQWIEAAVSGGAKVATGGDTTAEGHVRPTVLVDADPAADVCANEVFGPVVVVRGFEDLGAALAEANDTRYGLQAAIFTSDINAALLAARTLDFGGVLINEVPTWRADHMPYGGLRDSGNTREGPGWAIHEMTEERLVIIKSGAPR